MDSTVTEPAAKSVAETVATTCIAGVLWSSRGTEVFPVFAIPSLQCSFVLDALSDYESSAVSSKAGNAGVRISVTNGYQQVRTHTTCPRA